MRQSPHDDDNGPCIRLTDGSGWLFEGTEDYPHPLLREIEIEKGNWALIVLNSPAGIAIRHKPIGTLMLYKKVLSPGEELTCDKKVTDLKDVAFHHVKGTSGWVLDESG